MDDVAARVLQDDEDEQYAKGEGRDDKEVNTHQATGMVLKKCSPALCGRLGMPDPVLRYRGLRDVNPQLEQLSMNARRTL